MTAANLDWFELAYRDADGREVKDRAAVLAELGRSGYIRRRLLRLADGPDVRQVTIGDLTDDQSERAKAYEELDSEILAGLRLHRLVRRAEIAYPPQVSQLHGYESDSASPFALLIPWRGQPVSEVASHMLPDEQDQFLFSLLKGLSWLSAAKIAHRNISPASVHWDHQRREAQITDFGRATVTGVPRAGVGSRPWAGPEQQQNHSPGQVTDRDDLWGAGQLLYYLHAGVPMANRTDLDDLPALRSIVSQFFCEPHERPAPREVLTKLNVPDPVPAELRHDPLDPARQRFRALKAPGNDPPDTAGPDKRSGNQPSADAPARSRRRRSRRGLAFFSIAIFVVALATAGLLGRMLR